MTRINMPIGSSIWDSLFIHLLGFRPRHFIVSYWFVLKTLREFPLLLIHPFSVIKHASFLDASFHIEITEHSNIFHLFCEVDKSPCDNISASLCIQNEILRKLNERHSNQSRMKIIAWLLSTQPLVIYFLP